MSKMTTFFKSLFYTAASNNTNMQGTGFAWLVKPYLRKYNLNKDEEKKLSEYFNTHPSFITFVAAIFIKEYPADKAYSLKNIYASASAALGDNFFYHSLRPVLFSVSMFLAIIFSKWLIFLYPLVYALFRMTFVCFGWFFGSIYGENTFLLFNRLRFRRWAEVADSCSAFMLGAIFVYTLKQGGGTPAYLIASALLFITGAVAYKYVRLYIFMMGIIVIFLIFLGFYGGYELW